MLVLSAPGLILTSTHWGQWDSLSAALLVGSLLCLTRERGWAWAGGGALAAWAVLIKPQLAIFVAGFLVGLAMQCRWDSRQIRCAVAGVGGGVVTAQLILLPFGMSALSPAPHSLVERLRIAADLYAATTLGAPNLWMFFARRVWVSDSTVYLGLQARTLGHLATLAAIVVSTVVAHRYRERLGAELALWLGCFWFFSFIMLQTRVHERYGLPLVALLAALAFRRPVGERAPWLWVFGAYTLGFSAAIEASLAFGVPGSLRLPIILTGTVLCVLVWCGLLALPVWTRSTATVDPGAALGPQERQPAVSAGPVS